MKKKIISKIMSLSIIGLIMVSSTQVSAEVVSNKNIVNKEQAQAQEVTKRYLDAVVSKDVNTILSLSKQEIVSNEEIAKEDVENLLNNPNTVVRDFKIISSSKDSNADLFNVVCEVYYNNDDIKQEIFSVKKDNTEMYVYLKQDTGDSVKVINKGIDIPVPTPRAQLVSWDFDYHNAGGNLTHSTSSFSVSADYVHLNVRQSGTLSYTVYKNAWSGGQAVSWTSTQSFNNMNGSSRGIYLNLKPGENFTNSKLVVSMSAGYNAASVGELYAY